MKLFDVYSQYAIEPVKGEGSYVFDSDGNRYLDFYGGHAVISIGHCHPTYVARLKNQLDHIGFYSNAVQNSLQQELADKLEQNAQVQDYELFLCNSGAEANENALKLASFLTGKTRIIALENGFHGRTSAAVRATDNTKIQAPINRGYDISYVPINDIKALESELSSGEVCAFILEAIQGIGGCRTCTSVYLEKALELCNKHGAILIMDEVQAGYGRSGHFFAFQESNIRPPIITSAKGMGNGFPIAGVLIDQHTFTSWKGMLGTTFGGNHLACVAGIAVLDVIQEEGLIQHANELGTYFTDKLESEFKDTFNILGRGLMIGLEFSKATGDLRKSLLYDHHVFTGSSGNPNIMRILPPLNASRGQVDYFIEKLHLAIDQLEIA